MTKDRRQEVRGAWRVVFDLYDTTGRDEEFFAACDRTGVSLELVLELCEILTDNRPLPLVWRMTGGLQ